MSDTGLFTDLYELTMAAAYFAEGRQAEVATFDLFVRRLPPQRNYLVFVGLPFVLDYLEKLHFSKVDIAYLRSLKLFSHSFLGYLKDFKFSGQVESVAEGEIFFANEPVLKVAAPLIEAQIIETALINVVHIHCLLASKAARIVSAADGKTVIDFGARRSHGMYAAQAAAYASYLSGAAGTSNLVAGRQYDIPVFGTMAHSFVQVHDSEEQAWEVYLNYFPKNTTLLIDTYDTIAAAKKVSALAERTAQPIKAVRIDSGQLGPLTKQVRKILDKANLKTTTIFLSGDLDEYAISGLNRQAVPVDGYGIGGNMDSSSDAPSLDMVYKLSQLESDGRVKLTMKTSPGKQNLPGDKRLKRVILDGKAHHDIIGLASETLPGEDLLHTVMQAGRSCYRPKSWPELRAGLQHRLSQFAPEMLSVTDTFDYPVEISAILLKKSQSKA